MTHQEEKLDVFQGVADPTRRKILRLLAKKELSIASISDHFTISRNAVNKHINILLRSGLVKKEKSGRETHFMIKFDPLLEIKDWLAYFDKYWDEKLLNLKKFVETNDKLEKN